MTSQESEACGQAFRLWIADADLWGGHRVNIAWLARQLEAKRPVVQRWANGRRSMRPDARQLAILHGLGFPWNRPDSARDYYLPLLREVGIQKGAPLAMIDGMAAQADRGYENHVHLLGGMYDQAMSHAESMEVPSKDARAYARIARASFESTSYARNDTVLGLTLPAEDPIIDFAAPKLRMRNQSNRGRR